MPEPFFEFTGKPGDLAVAHLASGREDLGILLELASEVTHIWRVAVGTKVIYLHQDALELCK